MNKSETRDKIKPSLGIGIFQASAYTPKLKADLTRNIDKHGMNRVSKEVLLRFILSVYLQKRFLIAHLKSQELMDDPC